MAIIGEGYNPCEDYHFPEFGSKNYSAPRGVHIMNKDESKVMRKLKSQTGLSEEEIRKVKKYRVMLSEAQKSGEKQKRNGQEKLEAALMKRVTKRLKLPKEHPIVQLEYAKAVKEQVKKHGPGWVLRRYIW
tara:strand:- start:953 stop:1345 length:393 start_codon:yes stop_codon:yes gene_type:complete